MSHLVAANPQNPPYLMPPLSARIAIEPLSSRVPDNTENCYSSACTPQAGTASNLRLLFFAETHPNEFLP